MYVQQSKTVPLFVSADPVLGATNLTSGNDRFSVQFRKTLVFPAEAANMTLECNQANIWWTALNIKLGINDQFQLEINGDAVYTITLEPGLYNVSGLNSAINNGLINQGLASGIISLTGDNSTQKVLLTFTAAGQQVQWIAGSFFELVGFTLAQDVPVAFTTGIYSELAPNTANFSDISSFLVHTSLVQAGIPIGDQESRTIANPQINVPPGSLINFQPTVPIRLNVDHLRGQLLTGADFWITDQLNRSVDFNGEYFTILLVIRYHITEESLTHI